MNSMIQRRPHSGHSHHNHDNSYLTSTNKKDAGVRITRIGLYVNLGMAVSKGIGGYYFNSQALVADAFHALADLVSDFLTLATISVALKAPTAKFPNGYGKWESLGSVCVSGLLVAGGYLMMQHAGINLYHYFFQDVARTVIDTHDHGILGHSHSHNAKDMIPNINAAWLAAGSIVVKEYLYRATMKVAKDRKSSVLASNAVHHRIDSLTSIVALVAVGGSHLLNGAAWLDPVGGLLVSLMVIRAGLGNIKGGIFELVDVGVDDQMKASTRQATQKALDETLKKDVEILDIQGQKAGQNYLMDVELGVPGSWSVAESRVVERDVRRTIGSKVRGVRKVRVRFVAKGQESPDFADEFIVADTGRPSSPEPEVQSAQNHDLNKKP